jgi:hypothetical protein
MKNTIKLVGIIVMVAVIGFTFAACGGDDDGDSKGDPNLSGNVTIAVAGGGSAEVGKQLTANYSGSEAVSYKWTRGSTEVGTAQTYTPDTAGSHTVTVSAAGFKSKNASVSVAVSSLPALTGTVSISGTANVGSTLRANASGLGGFGDISYQWKRGTTNIGTGSYYIVQADDMGSTITVTVTREGYSGSVTSDPTDTVPVVSWFAVADSPFYIDTTNAGRVWRTIYSITWGNNKFVAVGDDGKIATSSDGVAWTAVADSTFGDNSRIWDIAWGNDKFIAVGETQKMATSSDGITWTSLENSFDHGGITWCNGKFVVVGYAGRMRFSSDGTTWTVVEIDGFGSNLNDNIRDITWGNDKFVAVGDYGKMAYSTDGVVWTAVADSAFGNTTISDITWGNDKFVAVGNSGKMAYSATGE